ncbi:MAG: PAS domain-containing protein [Sheuella sp.]|nr:PAS domain-containing protein [Sheuella sp.]
MHRKIDWLAKRETLRATAEALLPDLGKFFTDKNPTSILLNELLIHKVELEVQIDELKKLNLVTEEFRDRYLDLYDRSPFGLITLNGDGVITELNLSASDMLGIDRLKRPQDRFATFISVTDADKWHLFFLKFMEQNTSESEPLTLNLLDADMIAFTIRIYCQRVMTADQTTMLRLTLTSNNT